MLTNHPRHRRLLIIDDSAKDREVVRNHLSADKEHYYEVLEAENAGDGLSLLTKHTPDLVILDQLLGDRTGNEVLLEMRRRGHQGIAVVFITRRQLDTPDRMTVDPLTLGADDYLNKEELSGPQLRRALANAVTKAGMRSLLERSERQLRSALSEVQRRMAFEERLIGVVSHDLRTPLGTLAMGLELLRDEPQLSSQGSDVLSRLQRTTDHMIAMVTQLLDLTRIRGSGSFPIARKPIDLVKYVQQWVADVQATYPGRQIIVQVNGDGHGEFDPTALRQAFWNLISNALRHGQHDAPIEVVVKGNKHEVRTIIRNQGPSIASDLQKELFEPFMRSPASSGLGLGLYITREILSVHGGQISICSADNTTEFEIVLPRKERLNSC